MYEASFADVYSNMSGLGWNPVGCLTPPEDQVTWQQGIPNHISLGTE